MCLLSTTMQIHLQSPNVSCLSLLDLSHALLVYLHFRLQRLALCNGFKQAGKPCS